jgi:tagatose 6-phosphate kinase
MILCVTLNPCLDKTLVVPPWQPSESVRGRAVHEVVGGKGNNVARALRRLGRSARPVTFFGGPVGARCQDLLNGEDAFDALVIPTEAPTREILTVRTESSADQTAFFDPDPAITSNEAEALYQRVEVSLSSGEVEALTLSGSSPSEATHGLYSELIALARARRVPVFLDTYGPALSGIWGFWPDVMKLNRREATEHLRTSKPADADLFELLQSWARHGVQLALITDGAGPVLIQNRGRSFRVTPPQISVVNPIGSGDSLLAGLVDAWLAAKAPHEILQHGIACAVANALVWDAGSISRESVAQYESGIVIEPAAP